MLTTYKGREVLTNAKDLAEGLDLQVIYGDTDSVMINTNVNSYTEALKIGNEFKKTVNERYRLLEIDIDNVYQRLLLHAKKKYAALQLVEINGVLEPKVDVKGLDMRRREYCALSKEASQYCLNQILSGEAPELVVEKIHDYLRELGTKVRNGEFPVQKFIIYTVYTVVIEDLIVETWEEPRGLSECEIGAAGSSCIADEETWRTCSRERCYCICRHW